MGLYRRLNELETQDEIDPFAAEMIDRFGTLPDETANLLKIIEIKMNAAHGDGRQARRRRRRARSVSFHNDSFPDLPGLLAYVERLKGTAKLRPDSKLVITRAWADAERGSTARSSCRRAWRRSSAEVSPTAARRAAAGLALLVMSIISIRPCAEWASVRCRSCARARGVAIALDPIAQLAGGVRRIEAPGDRGEHRPHPMLGPVRTEQLDIVDMPLRVDPETDVSAQ